MNKIDGNPLPSWNLAPDGKQQIIKSKHNVVYETVENALEKINW